MTRTILCVEDEEDTGNLIQLTLEREGYVVARARDGRQAICLIETMLPPGLILLDLVVPYVNGFELLGALTRNPDWKHVPIIMLSADYYEPDIQRALAEGAHAYVVKNPGLYELVQTVRQLLSVPATEGSMEPTPNQACIETTPPTPPKRRASVRRLNRNSPRRKRAV